MSNAASLIIRPPAFDVDTWVNNTKGDLADALDGIEVLWGQLLVVKFIRDMQGSLMTSHQTRKEDLYQSKCGLVVKTGPLCFVDDEVNDFKGQKAQVGDWVVYRPADGADLDITPVGSFKKVSCKLLENESQVRMVIRRPDLVY